MKERLLFYAIAAGVLAGVALGWFAGETAVSLGWIGDLFLNALKMLVVPLVVCSMIEAVSAMFAHARLGTVARTTVAYYLLTTFIAVVTGLTVVSLLQPGVGVQIAELSAGSAPAIGAAGPAAIAGSLVTPNLFEAAVEFRLLPLLVFALVFGLALSSIGESGKTAVAFFVGCNQALLKLVGWLMYAAPVGIASLVAAHLGKAGGGEVFAREIAAIGGYFVAVMVGLAVHGLIVLPVILFFATRRNPRVYATNLGEALLTAFSTASSSATLAVTMRLSEERNGIRPQTAAFVLPLGATVNMDGTALYEAVAAMFIAQATGVDLSWTSQWMIVLTATLASVGAAGIPQAGLVTMVIVLKAVGLPLEGISAILAVDWLLDRFRTTVNVWGDAVGAAVVDARLGPVLHP